MRNEKDSLSYFDVVLIVMVILKAFDLINWSWIVVVLFPIISNIVYTIINGIIDYILN